MRKIYNGYYVSEEFYQRKLKEYAEAKKYKRQKRLERKAAKATESSGRKKWFGIF